MYMCLWKALKTTDWGLVEENHYLQFCHPETIYVNILTQILSASLFVSPLYGCRVTVYILPGDLLLFPPLNVMDICQKRVSTVLPHACACVFVKTFHQKRLNTYRSTGPGRMPPSSHHPAPAVVTVCGHRDPSLPPTPQSFSCSGFEREDPQPHHVTCQSSRRST